MRRRLLSVLLALAPVFAGADTITLTNGRVIQADRTWFEGSQLFYAKDGGVYGLPRTLVQKLEQRQATEATADADVQRARERLAASDPTGALRLLRPALTRDPHSLAALHCQVEAHLSLGQVRQAQEAAQAALAVDERNPRSRALLGDALAAGGDLPGAKEQYRRSLLLHPDAEVARKLGEANLAATPPDRGPQFRVRYDGGVNQPLSLAVLKTLEDAYQEYAKKLGFNPSEPVTVVLQSETSFEDSRPPAWAAGVNDGTIRVPVRGLERLTPALIAVLRHELAHSFVSSRAEGNCPTWLQEGIAQWLEGGDPTREDAVVAAAVRSGRLIPLLSLEGPFQALAESDAALAYAESLSAVGHILRLKGDVGIVRIVSALADRLPSEEALPVALALSYPELQKSWLQALSGAPADTSPR